MKKKEIWDWLHPKLCGDSGKSSINNSLQTGHHARSSAAGFEHIEKRRINTNNNNVGMSTNDARRASAFPPFGLCFDSGRMSGVNVDERDGRSRGVETKPMVIGVMGGLDDFNGVEETLSITPTIDIQEDELDENNPHDLPPSQIIQSQLQPSDHGRIKEIYCRFGFLADFLSSRRKHRHDAFNAFDRKEKNVESELDLLSGHRSAVGRIKKIFGWKIEAPTPFQSDEAKLTKKAKRVLLKKMHHKFETKKSDGRLVHTPSKELHAPEALEITSTAPHCKLGSTGEQRKRNIAHSSSSAEKNGERSVAVPAEQEVYSQGAADYRMTTDTDYIILEW